MNASWADRVVDVPHDRWRSEARALREEGFDVFDWLAAVDELDDPDPVLGVVMHVMAVTPDGLRTAALRTRVPPEVALDSLTPVWRGAAWHEREAHDMFGLLLAGFDDGSGSGLRPLLLTEAHAVPPLRKEVYLAARSAVPWPGAKEPGEGKAAAGRRRMLPPGVPGASDRGGRRR